MIKNILFPIDGNTHSLKALELVKELALKHDAKVIVLHSYFLPSHFNAHSSSHYVYLSNIEHNLKEQGQKILDETVNKLKEDGVNAHFTLLKGPAGPSIVETAQNSSVDMIIMSNRGLGNIKSALLNSVSNYVLHHATCPVLLVK
jgi:nucleotide-binding universal stress UspA family protein